jgi:hypothetical protein
MILPIGNNCYVAEALRDLNIRKCAYPFDWLGIGDYTKFVDFIILILNTTDIEEFCKKFFTIDNNSTFTMEYENDSILHFKNEEFNITFPHDTMDGIIDKHVRRIKRFVDDFNTSEKIIFVYAGRWDTETDALLKLMDYVVSINKNVKLLAINGFPPNTKTPDNIISYNIDYKKENVEHSWEWDQINYKQLLINIFKLEQSNLTSNEIKN